MASRTLVILISFLAAAYTADGNHENKIIGGRDAKHGEFPYQVSFQYKGEHICAGSIVTVANTQVILSAAHCMAYSANPKTAVAGTIKLGDNSSFVQERNITHSIVHPNYDIFGLANDIAIVFIDAPFKVNEYVAPIRLPRSAQKHVGNVLIAGWGFTEFGSFELSEMLQKVELTVINDTICQQAYSEWNIPNSMFCADGIQTGGKGTCAGDTGGPVRSVEGEYLAGIVVSGFGCTEYKYPSISTDISYFVNWIEKENQLHLEHLNRDSHIKK